MVTSSSLALYRPGEDDGLREGQSHARQSHAVNWRAKGHGALAGMLLVWDDDSRPGSAVVLSEIAALEVATLGQS